jgi:geranylgeranyl pyrophosphate synthase
MIASELLTHEMSFSPIILMHSLTTSKTTDDDVIDGSDLRRGVPSVHMVFGNKMAILAGDYLLARASIYLARLRNVHVVECMSTIIEHLVRGEVMQMRGAKEKDSSQERVVYYLRKNFYKTASLMANSCKSAALLGDYPSNYVDAAYRYGKHVGMAFQLVDDVLDFEGSFKSLGKPSLADLKAGLATAPVLFAAEEYPELNPLIERKFKQDGDAEMALELVHASLGLERTKQLAIVHAELAMDAIMELHASEYRDSLIQLAMKVISRTK